MNFRAFAAIVAVVMFSSTLIGALPLSAGASSTTTSCPANQTLRIAIPGGVPNNFNHLTSNANGGFTEEIMYATLQPFVNPSGVADQSSTILDWMKASNNFTVWTLNVKPGLKWSDGTPVTSADILATMGPNYALNPDYDFVNAHQEVKQEYALNSSAAVFVLNTPDANFPARISDPVFTAIVPKQATGYGPNFTGLGLNVIGDGPFQVSDYTSGSTQALLTRNPYYSPLPAACAIIVNYIETSAGVPTPLIANQADLGLVDPGDVQSTLSANPNLHVAAIPGHIETHLMLNASYYPYNDTQFRQALVYAINESAILQQVWNNQGYTAYNAQGVVPPGTAWYSAHQMNYSFSPSTAVSLLNSIGIKKGSDGYLQFPNGTDITLDLFADTGASTDPVMAQMVQSDLQSLGFKVIEQNAGLGALIGGSFKNNNNEQHGMLLFTSPGTNAGSAYVDSQSVCLQNFDPFACQNGPFFGPSGAYNDWLGNSSVASSTNNTATIRQALNNIQGIFSEYLPTISLAYPVEDWIYNTQHFNFGSNSYVTTNLLDTGRALNKTFLATICPIGLTCNAATTTSASSSSAAGASSSSSSSTTLASSASSASSSAASSAVSNTSTTTTGNSNTNYLLAGIAVVVIVVGAAAFMVMRRKPSTSP